MDGRRAGHHGQHLLGRLDDALLFGVDQIEQSQRVGPGQLLAQMAVLTFRIDVERERRQ